MLQIEHLTLTHRRDLHVLVEDFSLTLQRGDRAVLVGEEGNGKSTLLKWIYDPHLIEDYADDTGEVFFGKVLNISVPDEFVPHGNVDRLLESLRMDAKSVAKRISAMLGGK